MSLVQMVVLLYDCMTVSHGICIPHFGNGVCCGAFLIKDTITEMGVAHTVGWCKGRNLVLSENFSLYLLFDCCFQVVLHNLCSYILTYFLGFLFKRIELQWGRFFLGIAFKNFMLNINYWGRNQKHNMYFDRIAKS